MVLYLGRRVCGMKLVELAEAVGLRNYAVVGANATGVMNSGREAISQSRRG